MGISFWSSDDVERGIGGDPIFYCEDGKGLRHGENGDIGKVRALWKSEVHGSRHPDSRGMRRKGLMQLGVGGLLPPASEREARMDDPDARPALAGQTVHLDGGFRSK